MALITCTTIKKPYHQRIIDAALIYWELEYDYFSKKRKREDTTVHYRKSILYWLIKHNTSFSLKEIAKLFGFNSHSAVLKSIDQIEARKDIYRDVNSDINQISNLAEQLTGQIITLDVRIVNNKLSS